jgi:predicted transcriptional regulator
MKQIARRDRLKIYGDLLTILSEEATKEKIVLTSVQMRLNVPFDRLKNYITELYNLSLIENEASLKLTDKGKKFILEYEKILDFMEQMGIAYR